MLLTISTTYVPATDLGYLLVKNPARAQSFNASFGKVHVFYPEATEERCTVALLLDIDPVGLVRGRGNERSGPLQQYVNDRPYVASSFLSVALAEVFSSAMNGRSRDRPELVTTPLPLEATIAALPARGGASLIQRLFGPLGYELEISDHVLDPRFPEWGQSPYYSVKLRGQQRLSDLLAHLYVLIPVLDTDKHYYFGQDEIDKLLRRGEGWLPTHPERTLITQRYLRRNHYVREALSRLLVDEGNAEQAEAPETEETEAPLTEAVEITATEAAAAATAESAEPKISLHMQRLLAVREALLRLGAARIVDLGCGEGRLIRLLLDEPQFSEILGMDVSYRSLEIARQRLARMPRMLQQRVQLIQSSLTYQDQRLAGYDAAAVVEVIEHLDLHRLAAFERVLFGATRPTHIALTTPNVEYNVRYATMEPNTFRHGDHRFEWTRGEFQAWVDRVAQSYGYTAQIYPIGPEDSEVGAPSQMAIFSR